MGLQYPTFTTLSLTQQVQVIEWVDDTVTMRSILKTKGMDQYNLN
jgi:hypothetical protein